MDAQSLGICLSCGRPLTRRGPAGECLRCLVGLAFLPDGEPFGEAIATRRREVPGPLSYAHFAVEVGSDGFPVELGAGAMAITYRARDTILRSVVALKVIDRQRAENPAARARFLREARAAAQLHHPNVARVTYYGEQDGECGHRCGGRLPGIRCVLLGHRRNHPSRRRRSLGRRGNMSAKNRSISIGEFAIGEVRSDLLPFQGRRES
jgi:hypothetical protein